MKGSSKNLLNKSSNSFMTEVPIIYLSIDLQSKSMDCILYDKNMRHENVKNFFCYNNCGNNY